MAYSQALAGPVPSLLEATGRHAELAEWVWAGVAFAGSPSPQ